MTSLTLVAQSIKKYLAPLTVVFVIIVFILLISLKYYGSPVDKNLPTLNEPGFDKLLTKPSAIYTQNLSYTQKTPTKLPTYSIREGEDLLQKSDLIAKTLGFTDKPKDIKDITLGTGRIYSIPYSVLNLNTSGALSVYKNVITYKKSYRNLPPSSLSVEALSVKALTFFNNLGLSTNNLSEPDVGYSYFKDGILLNNNDRSKANFVTLTFFRKLENLQLVSQNSKIEITMDTFGNPVSFIYNSVQIGEKQIEYPLISAQDAQKLVANGQGKLIALKDNSSAETTISQLPAIQVQKMYLAYFYNANKPDTGIQPVWFFDAKTNIGKTIIMATFAVPAIQQKYFKSTQP